MNLNRSTYEDDNGYLRFEDTGQLVHRAIAQQKLGRYLFSKEVVHHLDMNKKNNDPENLYICRDQDEHEHLHNGIYSKEGRVRSAVQTILLILLLLAALAVLGVALSLIFTTNSPGLAICAIPPAIVIAIILLSLDNKSRNYQRKSRAN